jgi:hypothetical protein
MALPTSGEYLFAVLLDGREVFGLDAFPFRREMELTVAYSAGGERAVVAESQCRTLRLLKPEDVATLPDPQLWDSANADLVIRDAIKERCQL